jgi:hypothetical protein
MTTIQDLSNLESGLVISPWIAKIPGDMTFLGVSVLASQKSFGEGAKAPYLKGSPS